MAKLSSAPAPRRPSSTPARNVRKTPPSGPRKVQKFVSDVQFGFPWTTMNVIGVCVGVAIVILGYYLMSTAITKDVANNDGVWNSPTAVTVAPILLVIGYCIVIPFFIFKRFANAEDDVEMVEAAE